MQNIRRTAAVLAVSAFFTIFTAAGTAFAQEAALEPEQSASITVAPMTVAPVNVLTAPEATVPTTPIVTVPNGPPLMVALPQAVYVTHFVAVPAGAPASGMLARLRAALHGHVANRDAGLVAQAVVQRLNNAGVAARYLAPGEPPPTMGWLIGGVFHMQDDTAIAASDGTAPETEQGALGADVSITVADLEHGADTPFAILGDAPPAAAGSGQGVWRPYVVPAKLSFERADRNAAVVALAHQIVDAFVGNMTALRQADARTISP